MIRKEAPEVITGARGPRDVREAQAADQRAKRGLGLKRAPEGKVRFQATYSNLCIQLTAPPDLRDPFTGRITVSRPKKAQFRNHFYDANIGDQEVLDILQQHPNFGKTFWLLDDIIEIAKKNEVEATRKRLQEDPEFAEAVKAALTVDASSEFPSLDSITE